MWDVPAPGSVWTTPGSAPPPIVVPDAPPGLAPPGLPPTTHRVIPGAPKQRAALRTQLLAVVLAISLGGAVLTTLPAVAAVQDMTEAVPDDLTFAAIDAMDVGEQNRLLADLRSADESMDDARGPMAVFVVLTAILWITWQRRFVRNAMPFGSISGSLGWGTWGWIVPFANLYYPEAQLALAARISDPARLQREGGGGASPFVYLWWGSWSASTVLAIGSNLTIPTPAGLVDGTAKLGDFSRAGVILNFSFGLYLLAGLLGIATVLDCTRRQRAMLRALGVHA